MEPDEEPEGRRFTRTKTVEVIPLGGGEYRLEARLTDLSRGGNYGPGPTDGGGAPSSKVIHDVALTGRVRGPGLEITELDVQTLTVPYASCPFVLPALQQLIGKELMHGWRRAVLDLSGGTLGCTHVNTLLLGLTEMQTMVIFLKMNERLAYTAENRVSGDWMAAGLPVVPELADACYSLRRGGPVLGPGHLPAAKTRVGDRGRRGRVVVPGVEFGPRRDDLVDAV
jgi:Protein of unknown function (DUF2889)